jgi:chaperone modulatory protein CbpM
MHDALSFCSRANLDPSELEDWLAAGWLRPTSVEGSATFTEADVARALLVHDLRRTIGVNDAGVDVILDLIDQLHGLRSALRDVSTTVSMQSESVRMRLTVDARTLPPPRPTRR